MEFGRRPVQERSIKKAAALVFLPLAVFLLSGCQAAEVVMSLKDIDDKVGEAFNGFQADQQNAAINLFGKKQEIIATSTELTEEQKRKIDDWLDEKGLNRYGDDKNAMYKGGTPLFDESTGKAIDRYDYIISRYPNLLEELK
jgi:hypothetical protein